MNCRRVYVAVTAAFDTGGAMTPTSLLWEDGRRFEIDRVLDMRPAAAMKAGGQGDRFTVRINGRQSYLFFEHSSDRQSGAPGRWFVEAKTP
jgi:hypothetical protein